MCKRTSATRAARDRFFTEHGGITFNNYLKVNSNEAIKQAVQARLGLAVLSIHTLEVELMLKRLVVLDVAGFPIMRHWYLVHRSGKRFSAVAQAFEDFVLAESDALISEPTADTQHEF